MYMTTIHMTTAASSSMRTGRAIAMAAAGGGIGAQFTVPSLHAMAIVLAGQSDGSKLLRAVNWT